MADSVIVVGGETPAENASSEFLAGVAAATSTQAAETAQEAAQTADAALAVASAAETAVYVTAAELDELRGDVDAMGDRFLDALEIVAGIVADVTDDAPAVDDGAPEVVVNTGAGEVNTGGESGGDDQGDDDKPAPKPKKKFGSDWWFGPGR